MLIPWISINKVPHTDTIHCTSSTTLNPPPHQKLLFTQGKSLSPEGINPPFPHGPLDKGPVLRWGGPLRPTGRKEATEGLAQPCESTSGLFPRGGEPWVPVVFLWCSTYCWIAVGVTWYYESLESVKSTTGIQEGIM